MAKITKYIPVWNIVHKGTTYKPAGKGEPHKTLPAGFPEPELKRLLSIGAVKEPSLEVEDGEAADQEIGMYDHPLPRHRVHRSKKQYDRKSDKARLKNNDGGPFLFLFAEIYSIFVGH